MRMRKYEPRDLAAVVELFQAAVHETNSHDYSRAQIAAWAPHPPDMAAWANRLATGTVMVCESDGEMAGFLRAEADGTLDLLYVHPARQRLGVGRALVEEALARFRGYGLHRAVCEASLTARPFFERLGFHVVRRQTVVRRGEELPNFKMERSL